MLNILFSADEKNWQDYEKPLKKSLEAAGLEGVISTALPADQVDYIVYAPSSALQDFTPYTRAKAVLNLWAGVENVVGNKTLNIPLARMVDPGMTRGMVEWVAGHVLRHHLGMDRHIHGLNGVWRKDIPPLAADRRVCFLGLGALGVACGQALAQFGFDVSGWSRSAKTLDGITTYHGDAGLKEALGAAEILVLLLPLTAETENLLNAERLAWLPEGAVIINPGRGPLIDDAALLAALDTGQIGHATLDVFRVEPLPVENAYWAHKNVTVTPHIASETRVETAAQVIVENIRRGEAGAPFVHLVDRARGY